MFQHEQALLHRRMLTEKDNDKKLTITLLGTGMIAYHFCRSVQRQMVFDKCKEEKCNVTKLYLWVIINVISVV